METKVIDHMWTQEQALRVVKMLEPELWKRVRCHCALAGSVMYKGWSDKDLDLIIYPHHNAQDPCCIQVLDFLTCFFRAEKILKTSGETMYEDGREIYHVITPKRKRVEFFFLK